MLDGRSPKLHHYNLGGSLLRLARKGSIKCKARRHCGKLNYTRSDMPRQFDTSPPSNNEDQNHSEAKQRDDVSDGQ